MLVALLPSLDNHSNALFWRWLCMGFNYEDMHCAIISQTIPHVCPNLCVLQYNDTLTVAKMQLDLLTLVTANGQTANSILSSGLYVWAGWVNTYLSGSRMSPSHSYVRVASYPGRAARGGTCGGGAMWGGEAAWYTLFRKYPKSGYS